MAYVFVLFVISLCCNRKNCTSCSYKRVASREKVPSKMRKMRKFRSSCACAKYHPGICSPLVMILFADSKGPDQTARMRRLIWAFSVRICPKARFCIALPIWSWKRRLTMNMPNEERKRWQNKLKNLWAGTQHFLQYSSLHPASAGLGGSVGCASDWWLGGCGFNPAGSTMFFRWDWSWNTSYGNSLPSADSRRAVVSFWRKNVHNIC